MGERFIGLLNHVVGMSPKTHRPRHHNTFTIVGVKRITNNDFKRVFMSSVLLLHRA